MLLECKEKMEHRLKEVLTEPIDRLQLTTESGNFKVCLMEARLRDIERAIRGEPA